MSREAKYCAIHHYRGRYPIQSMCRYFNISCSAYYEWICRKDGPDRDADLKERIREGYEKYKQTYGYRRIRIWLKKQYGLNVNHKAVRRIMKENDMLSVIRKRRRYQRYSKASHLYPNLLERDFKSPQPNRKWVTDISYIPTAAGTLYLSVIEDLYDRSIISYKIGVRPTVSLVLETLDAALEKEMVADGLVLHSDQGFQYCHKTYFTLTQRYGITPSMSRRGNCLDNACCENFFGHLKSELVNRCRFQTIREAKDSLMDYIDFYNNERIQLKTELAPLEYRHQFYQTT